VAAFLNDYRGNRFIITSRPRGYEGEARQRLSSFCVECSIRDFDEEDISKFTHSWYEAVTRDRLGDNPDSIAVAKSKSDDLLEAIQDDERVAKLAANPLLLSVLAMVHQRGVGLPHRRAELYDECTDLLLGYWDQTKGGDAARELATYGQLSRSEKRALLEPIALWFHQRREEKTEADEKELQAEIAQQFQQTFGDSGQVALRRAQLFLQIIEERAGLLVERARGIYAFAHLTFQEYLTARAVADREDYISFTLRHLHDPWWLEVILLEVGHLSGTHHAARRARRLTTDLIKAIAEAGSMYENILRRDLVLACRCLCDTGTLGVEDNLRFRLFDELLSHWRELASNHRQWEIDEILDYAAATPAGLRICERLIQYSNDGDANVRLSVAACLGLIGASLVSNDLVKCLLKLTNDSSVIVRTNAIEALGGLKEIGFRDAIVNKMKELSSSSDPRVRSACAQAWGGIARVAPDEATEHLLKLTADEIRDVREAAEMGWDSAPASVVRQASTAVMEIVKQKERAEELLSGLIVIVGIPNAYLDAIGVKRLIALSKHQDAQVRSLVAEILSRIDDERVEAQLLALTRDSDASVRVSALGSVAFKERKYDSNGVVEALLRSAIDPNPGVRAVAATAFPLMEPFQEKLAASFSAMCRDKDKRVRAAAAQNLGRRAEDLRSRFVVSKLMALSSDEELSVRQAAAYGLAEVGDQIDDPNIINHLIVTLRRLDKDRRTSILYSLSRLASGPLRKGVIHALLKLTADGDPEIRAAGVTAFQFSTGIGTPPVISRLRDLLGDEAARLPAIYALERIGRSARQPSVIEQISNFLKHSDIKVRMAAAEALLGIQ
jgi:HEAT repeat protein